MGFKGLDNTDKRTRELIVEKYREDLISEDEVLEVRETKEFQDFFRNISENPNQIQPLKAYEPTNDLRQYAAFETNWKR